MDELLDQEPVEGILNVFRDVAKPRDTTNHTNSRFTIGNVEAHSRERNCSLIY